jgi:hypothetical protein
VTAPRLIHGLTVVVAPEVYGAITLRGAIADQTVEAARQRYGGTPVVVGWRFEAASDWTDPDSGEVLRLGDRWLLTVEVSE